MTGRRYRLLGGLEVMADGARLDLGGRKQRALLAVLLLADGATVSTDRIVDQVWGDHPPDRVEASLQAYVSTLRKILEPDRPPRAPATVLVTRGAGYALLAEPAEVDSRHFAAVVEQGRTAQAAGDLATAATTLRNALATYAPLLPEFDGEAFHAPPAGHLEQLYVTAQELSFQVRLDLGEHALVLADLERAVTKHPLHEELWALLALARYRSGRQSDALKAIADCKRLLAEEIGVDPGPRLRTLEADILAQAETVAPATSSARPTRDVVVGRFEELASIRTAVTDSLDGRDALVLVEGEPGAGKTRLLEEAGQRAHDQGGVQVLWGTCVEGEGAPSMWPWVQVLTQVLQALSDPDRDLLLDSDLGRLVTAGREVVGVPREIRDTGGRFRLFDQAGQLLDAVAERQPLMIVLDDVQWADEPSLALFVHLARRRPGRAVLVAAMRDHAPADALRRALATLSRLPGHRRVRLGPLADDDVAELVHRETGRWPAPELVDSVRSRTEGNPFFVRELSRLMVETGHTDVSALLAAGVPSGVRDVVRGRLEAVDGDGQELLRLAALVGRDVDLGLLARAAGPDVEQVLARLVVAESLGLIGQHPDNPFAYRFVHDLVREAISETVPPADAVRAHLRIADALEAGTADRDDVAERLAHHLWSAGPLAAPARTARALTDAARVAVRRFAHAAAGRHLTAAASLARTAGESDLELDAVTLLVSVLDDVPEQDDVTVDLRERADELAARIRSRARPSAGQDRSD